MAITFNADTTNGAVITSDTSGEIKLQSAGTDIATVNSSGITMASGKAVSGGEIIQNAGPSFYAYRNSLQTLTYTGGYIKVIFDTESWDTDSCYDTSTGLFTPTVAGYYQLNAFVQTASAVAQHGGFYKNGSGWSYGSNHSNSTDFGSQNSTIVYLNGTTDYVAYHLFVASTVNTATTATVWFNGALIRKA